MREEDVPAETRTPGRPSPGARRSGGRGGWGGGKGGIVRSRLLRGGRVGECGTQGRDVEGRLREPGGRLIQPWPDPRIPGGLGDGVTCPRPFLFPCRSPMVGLHPSAGVSPGRCCLSPPPVSRRSPHRRLAWCTGSPSPRSQRTPEGHGGRNWTARARPLSGCLPTQNPHPTLPSPLRGPLNRLSFEPFLRGLPHPGAYPLAPRRRGRGVPGCPGGAGEVAL